MASLTGKAIVITGAGRGIGAATAKLAARLGAKVLVNDIDVETAQAVVAEIEAEGGTAIADASDISQWDGAGRMVDACVAAFGSIDGLVNNAALFRPMRFQDLDEAAWRRTIDVDVYGVCFAMSHAVRHMLTRGSGAVVNLTSGAHQGAPDLADYGASKGAVASLTYCGAIDLGPAGIRVNAVSPVARTRTSDDARAFAAAKGHNWVQDMPGPEANAPLICFLLSDEAAAFNGQIIRVENDGISMLGHPTVLEPYVRLANTDYAEVRAAMLSDLANRLQPTGIRYGKLSLS